MELDNAPIVNHLSETPLTSITFIVAFTIAATTFYYAYIRSLKVMFVLICKLTTETWNITVLLIMMSPN